MLFEQLVKGQSGIADFLSVEIGDPLRLFSEVVRAFEVQHNFISLNLQIRIKNYRGLMFFELEVVLETEFLDLGVFDLRREHISVLLLLDHVQRVCFLHLLLVLYFQLRSRLLFI